jgi:NAD(P)-dependent dehydrogenase (short-subunit alcohol dehydrogenase family)
VKILDSRLRGNDAQQARSVPSRVIPANAGIHGSAARWMPASRGITVNNVQPGPIDTDLNPASGDWAVPQKAATALERYGRPDEIAAMVAFVAGPESSYITGANFTVDGGMNA